MNSKSFELLFYLMHLSNGVEMADLVKAFGLSERRIYSLIDEMKYFLEKESYGRVEKQGSKYRVQLKSREYMRKILQNQEVIRNVSILRRLQILIFVTSGDNMVTIRDLEEKLAVSRPVIKSDLEWLKLKATQHQIRLELIPFKGILAQAKEEDIRKALISFFNLVVQHCYLHNAEVLWLILTELEMQKLNEIILSGEENIIKFIPDQLLTYFSICVGVTIARIRGNHLLSQFEISRQENHETSFAEEILSKITGLKNEWLGKQAEIYFLTELLAGIPKVNYPLEDSHKTDWIFFQVLLKKFIKEMENYLHYPFLKDSQLFRGLLQHLYPAYIRMMNAQDIDNPIFEEILQSYSLEFHAVKQHIFVLEEGLKVRFNDIECSYIALFFVASQRRENKIESDIPKILVVCSAGVSTSYLLTTQLENLFSVEVVCVSSQRKLQNDITTHSFDFVLSTVDLEIAQEYIRVSPILSEEDIRRLAFYFHGFRKQIRIHPLIQRIRKFASIIDEVGLEAELNEYLNKKSIKKKGEDIMLKEILTESLVAAKVSAATKTEAITYAGKLLLENDLIEERYISAMLENVEKNGNYIVIAPGIAMPHARPEEGVKKIGMSLLTLAEPIVFGHKTNDPVKLVIGLCATDHESHLKALAELIEILADPEVVNKVLKAQNNKEILTYLLGGENHD
ncbi:BglG family transcription antiterminator [Clostridiales bacterium COT073_COT-073]|nr:BglG family transcription antiterminator [Clostridiales bacterium COT073_COT-073]